jgi:Zn-dependent protease with chaperone function
MSKNTTLYFDGKSNDAQEVRVLIFNSAVHLYTVEDNQLLQRISLARTSYKKEHNSHLLFFDEKQPHYLQFTNDHPLSATLAKEVSEANMPRGNRFLRSRALHVLAFLLAFLVGIYFLIISLVPYLGAKMIGVQKEIEIGDRIHATMLAEAKLLGEEVDNVGSGHLQAFADQLKLSANYPIRVTLVKSNTVNAYALPGGNIVVYTGLLEKIKTPEALTALLAHECTHVNERHSLRSLLLSAASSLAIGVVFGDASGIASVLASNAEALNGLRYSCSLEEEADSKGMELMLQNGVSADGMKQLMQTLQQAEINVPGTLSFLSSHPLTRERLEVAEKYLQQYPQKTAPRKDLQIIFQNLK